MSVEKGDFVLVDYVTKIRETDETFDTTLEEAAKQGGISKGDAIYEPMLIVVGEGWVLKELDQSLIGLEVGKPTVIEIPPEKGFGLRDPSKIRLVPIRRFKDKNVNLIPGAQVEVDGNLAVVRSVGSGRVQLDFNSPLAGKTLVYNLTVKSKIIDDIDQIKALIHRRIPSVELSKFKIDIMEHSVVLELSEEAFFIEGIQFTKRGIASEIHKFFPKVETVTFVESYIKTPQKVDETSQEQETVQADIESDQ